MIRVKCKSPKQASGNHQFDGFVEFARWLDCIKRAKTGIGATLCSLAEHGSTRTALVGYIVEADSDRLYHYKAKELAREVGVVTTKSGGDKWSKDPHLALEFATRLDTLG